MPYTLTYRIPVFGGSRGGVGEASPTSLNIDASGYIRGENVVTANGPTGISVSQQGTGVTLNIKIQDSNLTYYYPVGLAIQPLAGSQRAPSSVFPGSHVSSTDPTTVVLADLAQVPGAPGAYEFVVLFQVSNGNFGWLDPMISNEGG
jgi:hypothetical protein